MLERNPAWLPAVPPGCSRAADEPELLRGAGARKLRKPKLRLQPRKLLQTRDVPGPTSPPQQPSPQKTTRINPQ